MSHRFFYPAIFDPEDIGFSVYIPDTPGCMTQGDTMEEAMHMAQDASQLPATEVASLRESFDTSICLDRPGLLHSQSCEVQQRSGNYQSH